MDGKIPNNVLLLSGVRGSGKTTLINMLGRTEMPERRRVMLWSGDDYIMVKALRGMHNCIVLIDEERQPTLVQVAAVAVRFPDAMFVYTNTVER